MKIGIIGASGKAGQEILKEAVSRGHEVTAIVRDAAKIKNDGVKVAQKDIFDLTAQDVAGYDAVVNAFAAPLGQEHLHAEAGQVLIKAFQGSAARLIVVGGAGSLFVDEAKTVRLVDTPEFPDMFKATASNQAQNLQDLRDSNGVNWTFVSPAAFFNAEGARTGAYQTGLDNLIVNSKGDSHVSYADYAIAIVDEIENPKHLNARFTVVSE